MAHRTDKAPHNANTKIHHYVRFAMIWKQAASGSALRDEDLCVTRPENLVEVCFELFFLEGLGFPPIRVVDHDHLGGWDCPLGQCLIPKRSKTPSAP